MRIAVLRELEARFVLAEDTREPPETGWGRLFTARSVRKKLDQGDYSVEGYEDRFAIARKSLGDLTASATHERDRVEREWERLRPYPFRALVIEATLDDVAAHRYVSRATPASVIGTVVAWQVDFALPAIWAGTPEAGACITERLLRRLVAKDIERELDTSRPRFSAIGGCTI